MRHIWLFATLFIIMAATCCVRDIETAVRIEEKELIIVATREGDSPETRTIRDTESGAILWTPGDKISLFYGSGTDGGSMFTSQGVSNTAVTNFTGTIGVITGGADVSVQQTYFWGLYPYDPTSSCDGSSITMTLADHQVATPGTFATNLFPTIGHSLGLTMGFYNICGGLKIRVQKEGVKKVTFHSNDGPIAGKARIALDNSGIPYVDEIIEGSTDIVLEAPAGEYFEPGETYYFILFPHVFQSNFFTLTFETFTEIGTYERTRSFSISRSMFEGFNVPIDGNVNYQQKTGNIPVPDANFKSYLVENYDTNSDGEISYAEAAQIETIKVSTYDVADLTGIEYCTNLDTLWCIGSSTNATYFSLPNAPVIPDFYSLDVSNNLSLKELNCSGNPLATLNLSRNAALTKLDCSIGLLSSINLANNLALTYLDCSNTMLTSLDVSRNTALTYLDCFQCKLTSLDVTNNILLTKLECGFNHDISSLDLSMNTLLNSLSCHVNNLSCLDVSNNTALTELWCGTNHLTNLDVSHNKLLTILSCSENNLSSLDLSQNTALTELYCGNNPLTSLDISITTAWKVLSLENNQLTSLDVSNYTALTYLRCDFNQLTSLDVSHNTALTSLYCSANQLTSLDVSTNTSLEWLQCANNQLTNLDVSHNYALQGLEFNNNQLTSLDLSNNTSLVHLYCDNNLLTCLDVSKNTELGILYCRNNQLTSLDVSNLNLRYFGCSGNLLSSLNVSSCSSLRYLVCSPMNDANEQNLLAVLHIYEGQVIPNVTENRSTDYIPAETNIIVAPTGGGNEGSGDHNNNEP